MKGRNIAATLCVAGLYAAPLVAADDEVLAVAPDDVKKLWVATKDEQHLNAGGPVDFHAGCATVSYVIEANGKTSNVTVLRSIPEGDVATLARSLVRRMRFEPTALNADKTPVYTYTTVTFNFGKQPDKQVGSHLAQAIDFDALDSACAVKGFAELESLGPTDG